MQTADFAVSDFDKSNDNKGVYPRFFVEAVKNERLSAEQGRPVFEDREFVEIIAAGNANNIVVKPVRMNEINRFPREYRLFKEGQKEQLVGTPLSEIPWMTKSMVEELKYMKVLTLEHLAAVSDDICGRYAGLYEAKRKAQEWLEAAKSAQPFTKMAAENQELRDMVAAMQEQMVEMQKQLASNHKKG